MNTLDKKILKAVTKTPARFADIKDRVSGFPTMREVDRGLQRLRKAGKVEYITKAEGGPGWRKVWAANTERG